MVEQKEKVLIDALASGSDFDKKQINELIDAKQASLKGLVSREGAITMVANDMGVKLNLTEAFNDPAAQAAAAPKTSGNWRVDAVNDPPAIGNFLPIIQGVTFTLKFTDIDASTQGRPVTRDSAFKNEDGTPKQQTKFWFNMTFVKLEILAEHKAMLDALALTDADFHKKQTEKIAELIKEDNMNKDYIVTLPKSGRYALGVFAQEVDLKDEEEFTLVRLGNTKFILLKI